MSAPFLGLFKQAVSPLALLRSRAKVLAREDRRMRTELISVRRLNGLTQADVAEIMGVTQQAVQKIERYDADPKLSTLRRYANATGAIVEHRVTRDYGQSMMLAQTTTWSRVGHLPTIDESRLLSVGVAPSAGGQWSTLKRTDFRLTA